MKKYGLQLRVPPSQQKKQPTKPPLPPPLGFRDDDDDDDVEREISRHARKNKALREIEEQHKKALEEDPSVFDYDGVYDEMKEKTVRHKLQIREDRQPKYIHKLVQKAEERQREHDVIYERKLAKERNKEEHLYADKDKFVTSAYKKKLEEREKWEAQQRLRDLRDEKEDVYINAYKVSLDVNYEPLEYIIRHVHHPFNSDHVKPQGRVLNVLLQILEGVILGEMREDRRVWILDKSGSFSVTKKKDLSDFYFNIGKNIAFGGNESKKLNKQAEQMKPEKQKEQGAADTPTKDHTPTNLDSPFETRRVKEGHRAETSMSPRSFESSDSKQPLDSKPVSATPGSDNMVEEKSSAGQPSADQPKRDHHKRSEDAIAAAKARFLARKRAKEQ
ncbi:hypothetical protein JRO89_XS10G0207700 [Xanthoceras sorbifolium]|uniref:Nuclear speckle splicing regulatory protein 1 N-terminal domain-containing protein n=1 Tax=Xanthoceras sorbifolium TaxID=99658 RepID=A0ABQ8HJN7_9ROSI|nr:hypothetical protein JRO89_XS10G0207700 [Xanthoceras sorbifolium]